MCDMGLSESKAKNASAILAEAEGSFIRAMTQPYFQLPIGLSLWFSMSIGLILDLLTQAQ